MKYAVLTLMLAVLVVMCIFDGNSFLYNPWTQIDPDFYVSTFTRHFVHYHPLELDWVFDALSMLLLILLGRDFGWGVWFRWWLATFVFKHPGPDAATKTRR